MVPRLLNPSPTGMGLCVYFRELENKLQGFFFGSPEMWMMESKLKFSIHSKKYIIHISSGLPNFYTVYQKYFEQNYQDLKG